MEVCGGQTHSIVRYGIDRDAAPGRRAGARAGLPGLRDRAGDDRSGAGHRRAARTSSSRRSATCSACRARAAISCRCGATAPTCGSSTRRSTRCDRARQSGPAGRVPRDRLRDDRARQRDGALAGEALRGRGTSRCSLSHVLVPPAIAAILQAPGNRVQAFLGPGHVCAVVGIRQYEALATPLPRADRGDRVRTGRPPARRARGGPPAGGRAGEVENRTRGPSIATAIRARARRSSGRSSRSTDRKWRGIGAIGSRATGSAEEFRDHDAERAFEVGDIRDAASPLSA